MVLGKIDILEMHQDWPLLELMTDDDVFGGSFYIRFFETEQSNGSVEHHPFLRRDGDRKDGRYMDADILP